MLQQKNNVTMKTEQDTGSAEEGDDLLREYNFDYRTARPNRFAAENLLADGSRIVVLEPDVARVFTTPESVNAILRALIATMPAPTT